MAMNRMKESDAVLPPLTWDDLEQALNRTRFDFEVEVSNSYRCK